jgi:pSer/pThr/pTyr-binding forkhead associated (FHA) protein
MTISEKSITDRTAPDLDDAARFEFVSGPRKGASVAIDRQIFFIGRSRNNNLILTDRSVSRKHAVLNYLDGHFVLSDLDSYWGVHLNGKRVREAQLEDGDLIKFGVIEVKFRAGVAPSQGGATVKGGRRLLVPILTVSALVLIVILYFTLSGKKSTSKDVSREIEFNYEQGIKAYNVEKNPSKARMYWQKVLDLDPQKSTPQARKAMNLLGNLSDNTGGQESR